MSEQTENRTVMTVQADLDERIAYRVGRAWGDQRLDVPGTELSGYAGVYGDYRAKRRALEKNGAQAGSPIPVENSGLVDAGEILPYEGRSFVRMAYLCILGRVPAEEEILPVLNALQCGAVTKEQQLFNMADSVEGFRRGVSLTGFAEIDASLLLQYYDRTLVRTAYSVLLGRPVDPAGEAYYLRRLRSGELTRTHMLDELSQSPDGRSLDVKVCGLAELLAEENQPKKQKKPEVLDVFSLFALEGESFVTEACRAVLGREPDQAELGAYTAGLQSGNTAKADLIRTLADEPEAVRRGVRVTGYPELSLSELLCPADADFLENAYILLLRRLPDAGGAETWRAALRSGRFAPVDVLYGLYISEECRRLGVTVRGLKRAHLRSALRRRLHRLPAVGRLFGMPGSRTRKSAVTAERLKRAEEQIAVLGGRMEQQGTELRGMLTSALENTDRRLEILREEMNACRSEFGGFSAGTDRRLSELDRRLEAVGGDLDTARKEFTDAIDAFSEGTDSRIAAHDDRITAHDDRITAYEDRLAGMMEELSAQRTELIERIGETAALLEGMEEKLRVSGDPERARLTELERCISDIWKFTEQAGKSISELYTASGERDTLISGLMHDNEDVLTSAKKLIGEYSKLSARVEQLARGTIAVSAGNAEAPAAKPAEAASDPYSAIDYFDFENHFRGSMSDIKNRQRIYLPYFEGRKNVLDLGCGRGEFTELLSENGIGVTGVDLYGPYVEYMKLRGLPVVLDDALRYLEGQEQVDGVFLGQVVEHISVNQIVEILRTAYEKLEPGAFMIVETPNPASLWIYANSFYVDPSHIKPVHPVTLQYLAQKAGFSSVEILYTEGSRPPYHIPELPGDSAEVKQFNETMKTLSDLVFGSQDYAIIARK